MAGYIADKLMQGAESAVVETIKKTASMEKQLLITQAMLERGQGGEMSLDEIRSVARNLEKITGYSRVESIKAINALILKGVNTRERLIKSLIGAINITATKGGDITEVGSTIGDALNGDEAALEEITKMGAIKRKQFKKIAPLKGQNSWSYKDSILGAIDSNVGGNAAKSMGGIEGFVLEQWHGLFNILSTAVPTKIGNHKLPKNEELAKLEAAKIREIRRFDNTPEHRTEDKKWIQASLDGIEKNIARVKADIKDYAEQDHWLTKNALKKEGASFVHTPPSVEKEKVTAEVAEKAVAKVMAENNNSCPFGGKNIEDIAFNCECDCSEKKDAPTETQPTSLNKEAGALDGDAITRGLSLGKGKGSPLVSNIMPMEGPLGGIPGMGGGSDFDLSKLLNGGVKDLIGDFDQLGDSAKSIFKDMGLDLSSIFKDGGISLDGFFGKLDGVMQNNPFGKMLGGLFGGEGLPGMGLSDLFTGGIDSWTNKFDFLNTSVSKIFGGWQKDVLSVFNQGNFSIDTFANKLLNLSANNPLQGFFGQLQGYMSSLSSFSSGGGGGFLDGLLNIATSAIGGYFGYSAPVSSGGGGGDRKSVV